MTRDWKVWVLAAAILLLAAPILIYSAPLYFFTPDIQYVKAKILRVMIGQLYADPISGFPSFHPPWYHVVLSVPARLGVGLDVLLRCAAVQNIVLIFLFSYLILRRVFDRRTAFFATLLVPFVFQHMGPAQIYLATAFYYSLPFFMAGLWLYLAPSRSPAADIAIAVLWGLAFLISPVYVFAIGFTLADELIIRKNFRRVGLFIPVFLIVIIPFFVQAYSIYGPGLAGSSTFALWRGLPDLAWLQGFFSYLVSPLDGNPFDWHVLFAIAAAALGILGYRRHKERPPFIYIVALAFLFTAYHFSSPYASRILFFVTLFLAGFAVEYLQKIITVRRLATLALVLLVMAGAADHYWQYLSLYEQQKKGFEYYVNSTAGVKANLGKYLDPRAYVLATGIAYRTMIMPLFPVHGLLAYKTGEYFQLNPEISRRMLDDYHQLMNSTDPAFIEEICKTYNMTTAVAGEVSEMKLPVFQTIARNWTLVFRDAYFRIYIKPTGSDYREKPAAPAPRQ
ncbi:MAG: hypothetical protein PHR28_00510 [candidate division Zixibacteria bacterium]|nr:hypothetical protein [candidate division Zixibacteria bacterium]